MGCGCKQNRLREAAEAKAAEQAAAAEQAKQAEAQQGK